VHILLEIVSQDPLTIPINLSRIVLGLKAYVTKIAKELGIESKVWQKSFHDHIIRDGTDLETHYEYIITNVDHWREDEYNNFN
jgi:putative transposase